MPRNANKSMPSTLPWLDLVTAVAMASDVQETRTATEAIAASCGLILVDWIAPAAGDRASRGGTRDRGFGRVGSWTAFRSPHASPRHHRHRAQPR